MPLTSGRASSRACCTSSAAKAKSSGIRKPAASSAMAWRGPKPITASDQNISLRFAANGRYYFEDSDQEFLSTPSLTNRYNPTTGELTHDFTWALNPATNTYVS